MELSLRCSRDGRMKAPCCVLLSAKAYNKSSRHSLSGDALRAGLLILAAGASQAEARGRASAKVYANEEAATSPPTGM